MDLRWRQAGPHEDRVSCLFVVGVGLAASAFGFFVGYSLHPAERQPLPIKPGPRRRYSRPSLEILPETVGRAHFKDDKP